MTDAIRLDMVSLRCTIAGQLGAALATQRDASTAQEFVDAYLEVLDVIRDQSIYPSREEF